MGEGMGKVGVEQQPREARRDGQPAESTAGVVSWLRPLAYVGWLAFVMLFPLLIHAIFPTPFVAIPASLMALVGSSLAAWFVARGQLIPTRIDVGTDGVSVSWLGLRWFHSFEGMDVAVTLGGCSDEVAYNHLPNEAVQLTYQDGRTVKLGVIRRHHAALADSINRRLDEYRAADRPSPRAVAVAALQCGDKSPEQWLAALGKRPVEGYRTDLTRDQLLAVLQDPSSPPTARAAAAKLLRARVEDRPLIRIVAEQTAQPKMRIALEAAASEEEEAAVDEALTRLAH